MQQIWDNLRSLGLRRVAILGASAATMMFLLVYVLALISTPDRDPLYRNLSASSANAIQVALIGSGFDAQLSSDQTEISVPRADVARARMAIAEMGLSINGDPGWEIFDEQSALAMNSFMQRVNRLRAMEGELGRSIQTLDNIQSARVHLVLPEREPFSRSKPDPRASVIVRAAMGHAIERKQAVAIRSLIASSVPELSPEHVTVLSAKGETILGGNASSGDSEQPIQAAQIAMEDRLARQVEDILSARVGAGNARVRVNVDLTKSREVVVEEIFDPEQQVVRATENKSERRDELENGGNVGVENNIPEALRDGTGADNARSSQENVGESVEYEIGSTRRETVREAGEIERISVAVLVNGIYSVDNGDVSFTERSPEELAQLSELVRSAVGFDDQRGDTVSVASLRFMDYSMEVGEPITKSISDHLSENIVSILRALLGMVVVCMVLLLGVRPLLRQLSPSLEENEVAAIDAPVSEPSKNEPTPLSNVAAGISEQAPAPNGQSPIAVMPGDENTFDPTLELGQNEYIETMGIRGRLTKSRVHAVRNAADERPDEVLRVLRGWLATEANP